MQTDIDKPVMLTALPYKDCQKALAIINWLANCHTREELNQVLKTAINPLIDCNGAFYIRFLGNKKTPQLLDGIHQSVLFQNDWTEFLEAFIAAQKLPNPIKEETMNVLNFINYSCGDSACQYDSSSNASHQKTNYYTSVALFDTPEQTAAIYFYRMNPLMQDFSPRVIELLKLLRHALLGTIKTIIFLEECRNKLPNYLYKHAEPMAIVCNNGNL